MQQFGRDRVESGHRADIVRRADRLRVMVDWRLGAVAAEPVSGFFSRSIIRTRLRQLPHDKLPTKRVLAVLRELAQEYKAFPVG